MGGIRGLGAFLLLTAVALVDVPAAHATPPDVGYVGDSLGVEAENEIRQVFRGTRPFTVLAVANGAYVDWVRRHWVESILSDPPSILIVELGHGDANKYISPESFREQVDAFLQEVAPRVDCVRWLDVKEVPTYYAPVNERAAAYNQILRQEAFWHHNVEVVDYSYWAEIAPPSHWERDGMHLTPPGERALADMIRLAADGCDRQLSSGPWWDVPDHYWAAPAIRWLHQQGIADGYGNGTFRAVLGDLEVPVDRGQLADMLWRRAGSPPGSPPTTWSDVPEPLRPAAAWVQDQDLIPGLADGRFRPQRMVTRAELIRTLWRLEGSPVVDGPAPWTDVTGPLVRPLAWAHGKGLTDGFVDGDTFAPSAPATRARTAQLLAPADVPDPPPAPELADPYPPPRVLRGDAPQGNYFLDG